MLEASWRPRSAQFGDGSSELSFVNVTRSQRQCIVTCVVVPQGLQQDP